MPIVGEIGADSLRFLALEDLITSPYRGNSFEGYIIEQIHQTINVRGSGWESSYLRTSDQVEVDLILTRSRQIIPIEIKCKLTPSKEDIKSLIKFCNLASIKKAFLVCLGKDQYPLTKSIQCIGVQKWISEGCPLFWE